MPRFKKLDEPTSDTPTVAPVEKAEAKPAPTVTDTNLQALVAAFVQVIEQTRPTPKKTAFNRRVQTPWTPKDGSKKLKLKRKLFQHGIPVDEDIITNEDIGLANRLRAGTFLTGDVRVLRRKDRGLDIDYPIKTAAQKLRLISKHGITSLTALLARLVEEGENPNLYKVDDVDQD